LGSPHIKSNSKTQVIAAGNYYELFCAMPIASVQNHKDRRSPRLLELTWQDLLAVSVTTAEALFRHLNIDRRQTKAVIRRYPMRINPYYLSLIGNRGGPLWRQAVPDIREIQNDPFSEDPQQEAGHSPVPHLVHRYPDRALFIVSNRCALHCRHCFRKRLVGKPGIVSPETIDQGLDYIRSTPAVREVILSGGDPLLLEDHQLDDLLQRLRDIRHVEVLRIHSRVPYTLPQRITPALVALLKRFHPLYFNTQFNHPDEITPQATAACALLADAGIPLGCQTVLLKGINDSAETMQNQLRALLKIRVKPYYLHHADPVKGTAHLRTTVACGLAIMQAVRSRVSGMAIPRYVIDLPGGGKIPVLPTGYQGYE
jgi:lysine 2,3-aminomutase